MIAVPIYFQGSLNQFTLSELNPDEKYNGFTLLFVDKILSEGINIHFHQNICLTNHKITSEKYLFFTIQ